MADADASQRISLPLRRLRWPQPAPVDLVVEFPWLILHESAANEWSKRRKFEQQDDTAIDATAIYPEPSDVCAIGAERACSQLVHLGRLATTAEPAFSPYKQKLCAPHSPPLSWTPAQRAARKMLKLQKELDQRDEHARYLAARAGVAPRKNPVLLQASPDKRATKAVAATAAALSHKSPTKKPKAASLVTGGASSPQARLQQWLAGQCTSSPCDPVHIYSTEMETRIQSTMHATLGSGWWRDQVASPIAAELTSESVFGGGVVSARRMPFLPPHSPVQTAKIQEQVVFISSTTTVQQPQDKTSTMVVPAEQFDSVPESTSTEEPVELEIATTIAAASPCRSAVEMFASEVREQAVALVAEGSVSEALQALQAGIDRVLHDFHDRQDVINANGFNYSTLAHQMATRVQLMYRARHRRRLVSLMLLQRVWRRSKARRKFAAQRRYCETSATVIQRVYKKRLSHRKRNQCVARIQRCVRIFQAQKLYMWLHRACRLATAEQRRQRERIAQRTLQRRRLWTKLTVFFRMLRLLAMRRHAITCLQKRFRGCKARHKYAVALEQAVQEEHHRTFREDEFVEPRLRAAVAQMAAFYRDTSPGRALVRWEQRRPWLRWRRLRNQWRTVGARDRAVALCRLHGQSDQSMELRGLHCRCAAAILLGRPTTEPVPTNLRLDPDSLVQWIDNTNTRTKLVPSVNELTTEPTFNAGTSKFMRGRERLSAWTMRLWARASEIRRQAAHCLWEALWSAVVYPRLFVTSSFLFRPENRSGREAAVAALLDRHEREFRALLRRVFRVLENDPPKFECPWCNEGLATAKLVYAHRNALGTGCIELERRAEREQDAVAADVQHYKNRYKPKWVTKNKNRNDLAVDPTIFAVDAPWVYSVATKRGNHTALVNLVDAASSCGTVLQGQQLVPMELFVQLVGLLETKYSDHPLERICAAAESKQLWNTVRQPPLGWITVDEASTALGLTAPKPSGAIRVWTKLQATWTQWRRSSLRYQPTTRGARVLAAA